MQYSDKFADLTDPESRGAGWTGRPRPRPRPTAQLHRVRHRHRPRGDLLPRRPVRRGRPPDRPRRGRRAARGRLGQVLRGRPAVRRRARTPPGSTRPARLYQGMINQIENAYEEADGTPLGIDHDTEVEDIYDAVLTASVDEDLSAHLLPVERRLGGRRSRATRSPRMLCPGWMLGVIEGNAAGVRAGTSPNVFPGGGGNWGGSYLTVPTQGEHPEEAKALAAWLTAPEQQIKAFTAKGTFPSQVERAGERRAARHHERVLQRRPDRRDPRRTAPTAIDRDAVQGPELLRDPPRGPGRPHPGRRRRDGRRRRRPGRRPSTDVRVARPELTGASHRWRSPRRAGRPGQPGPAPVRRRPADDPEGAACPSSPAEARTGHLGAPPSHAASPSASGWAGGTSRLSPYLYISPVLPPVRRHRAVPARVHRVRLGARLAPHRRARASSSGCENFVDVARPAAVLDRAAQHLQHLPAVLGAPGDRRDRDRRDAGRQPARQDLLADGRAAALRRRAGRGVADLLASCSPTSPA